MSCDLPQPHPAHVIPLEERENPDIPMIGAFCSGGIGDLSIRVKRRVGFGKIYLVWGDSTWGSLPALYGVYTSRALAEADWPDACEIEEADLDSPR